MRIATIVLGIFVLLHSYGDVAAWPLPPEGKNLGERSESRAKVLALAATIVPALAGFAMWSPEEDETITGSYEAVSLISAGLLLGPMVGHAIVGDAAQGFQGFAIRTGILVATMALYESEVSSDQMISFEGVVAVAGGLALVTHALYDIGQIRYGRSGRMGLTAGPVEAAPYVMPLRSEAGMTLTLRF